MNDSLKIINHHCGRIELKYIRLHDYESSRPRREVCPEWS